MNSNPKIVVLHMKELLYTAIFIAFALLLIILLIFMFKSSGDKETSSPAKDTYTAGVYASSITVNGTDMQLQVTLDSDNINAVELKNTDEAISAMYPLISSSVADISEQIVSTQSTNNISYSDDCKYTYQTILSNVNNTLSRAKK